MRQSIRFVSAVVALLWASPLAAVVLSEIHYHPPSADYRGVEFVELHNTSAQPVDIGGWRLKGGADFTFPEGTVLAGSGYLAVCKDLAAVGERFGTGQNLLLGNYKDFLDNGGELIVLVDRWNAFVDGLTFDDKHPWPEDADGGGSSLQRLCGTSPARDPRNWTAAAPTPGAPNRASACPPPAYPTPPVVITELQYHPKQGKSVHPSIEDGEDAEFIELHNPGPVPVDVGQWKLTDAVDLEIPAGTTIPPAGYILAGRDPAKLSAMLGVANVIATGYSGRLSNGGERVALSNARGEPVDSVTYADAGDWPYGADGLGRTLEKVVATLPGYDPANWKTSTILRTEFQHLVGEGPKGQGLGQKFVLSIDGPGEVLVDHLSLEDITTQDVKVILDETFDAGIAGWTVSGSAAGSVFAPGEGIGGSGALRLVSTASCPNGECGSAHSVSRVVTGVTSTGKYRVAVDFKAVSGSPLFYAGLFKGAGVTINELASAGKANTVQAAELPPYIAHVDRFPRQPRSADPTWITALVRAKSPAVVGLSYSAVTDGVKEAEGAVALLDDGQHRDHLAGDGVFGGEIPAFPHNTQVRFRIRAVVTGPAGDKVAELPAPLNEGTPLPEEVMGYYVDDLQPETDLPLHHILLDQVPGNSITAVNELLQHCEVTVTGSFAAKGELFPDVSVRFRGNTACYVKKRNFKVTFNRGRLFGGLKKLNLNSEWTDKSLVREHLSWEFLREIGSPYCKTEFTRLHVNGGYFGLYLYVEHPDDRFLERNELDSGGNLYKAKQPSNDGFPIGVPRAANANAYRQLWEEEANEGGDFADIQGFIDAMHTDGSRPGGPTTAFWQTRSIEEIIIAYQLGQVVLNNIDSFAKNHFLYHDLRSDRWGFLTWDLDLTFGKFFTFEAVDPAQGREVGTLNDKLLCGSEIDGDLNPWFAATVLQNPLYNYLVDFFFRAGRGFYHHAYLTRLADILDEKFRNETYDPRLDTLLASLAEEESLDHARWGRFPSNVPGFPQEMDKNIAIVKEQLACHRDFLRSFLRAFHPEASVHPRLKITEIMYLPEGGDEDLEFLEITSFSSTEADISGWKVTGIGKDGDFSFPAGSVVQPDQVFVVARSPAAFRARYPGRNVAFVFGPYAGKLADEGEEIRILDAGPDFPATIDFLKYDNEGPWPDVRPGHSIELAEASRDRDNDPGENWRASSQLGGTPGTTEPVFVRSNVNGDSKTDLTDVISVLNHLFLGGRVPACLDAADSNDDGQVGITDAIFTLQHLFQGGLAPYPPYPDPGPDPTRDDLGCGS